MRLYHCDGSGDIPELHGIRLIPRNFRVDETKSPKQISFGEGGAELNQLGIYELTETTLRIQLAKIGESRPTELVADQSLLPEGQLLLELERSFDPLPGKATP